MELRTTKTSCQELWTTFWPSHDLKHPQKISKIRKHETQDQHPSSFSHAISKRGPFNTIPTSYYFPMLRDSLFLSHPPIICSKKYFSVQKVANICDKSLYPYLLYLINFSTHILAPRFVPVTVFL